MGVIALFGCSSIPTKKEATELRGYYCNGSTALRNATYNIVLKIKRPKGIPIERAGEGLSHVKESLRAYMQIEFLYNLMSKYIYEYHGVSSDYVTRYYFTTSWPDRAVGSADWFLFLAVTDGDLPEDSRLENLYKAFSFPASLSVSQQVQAAMQTANEERFRSFDANYQNLPSFDVPWYETTYASTTVEESAQDDDSIHYTITLDMSLFCKYAVPRPDLYAN